MLYYMIGAAPAEPAGGLLEAFDGAGGANV